MNQLLMLVPGQSDCYFSDAVQRRREVECKEGKLFVGLVDGLDKGPDSGSGKVACTAPRT
jgi:hypothetical protein